MFSWVVHVVTEALCSTRSAYGPCSHCPFPSGASARCVCSPFHRARRHGRSVANTQARGLLGLLVKVLVRESLQLFRVVLLDGAPFAVEPLDIVEPVYAVGDPGVRGFEAILPYVGSALQVCLLLFRLMCRIPSVQRRGSAQPPPQPWSLSKCGLGAMTMQASSREFDSYRGFAKFRAVSFDALHKPERHEMEAQ